MQGSVVRMDPPPRDFEPSIKQMMRLMSENLAQMTNGIAKDDINAFLSGILAARRVFVLGVGRSGLVAAAFAMRLIHLGIPAFVIGETIVPRLAEMGRVGDLLVVFSSTGRQGVTAGIAADFAGAGDGKVFLITGNAESPVGKIADHVILFECDDYQRECAERGWSCFAPLGTCFETTAWVFADAAVSGIMEAKGIDAKTMGSIHANLMGLFLIPDD
jgi:6-phospho-3-hexuloisomerase